MNRFDDKRVLISGAGSGIGQATVARILAEGGTVVAADISETGLEQTLNAAKDAGHSDRLTTVKVDISSEESVREQVGAAIKALGGLDVLVNAAGILRSAHTHEMTLDFWNTVIGGQPHRNFPHDEGVPAGTARKRGRRRGQLQFHVGHLRPPVYDGICSVEGAESNPSRTLLHSSTASRACAPWPSHPAASLRA